MAQHNRLQIIHEERGPNAIESDLCDYCGPHDLLATVQGEKSDIVVYRLNGQIAFRIPGIAPDEDATAVKWKPDGSVLGVGWSNGVCGVYSGEDGKVLSQSSIVQGKGGAGGLGEMPDAVLEGEGSWRLDLEEGAGETEMVQVDAIPSCVGWCAHVTGGLMPNGLVDGERVSRFANEAPPMDGMAKGADTSDHPLEMSPKNVAANGTASGATIPDLVNEIATMDVTANMPTLSALPSHGLHMGVGGSKFNNQADLNELLSTSKYSTGIVDTLITTGTSGDLQVFMNDSVNVGLIRLPARPARHASHPQCTSQVVLSEPEEANFPWIKPAYRLSIIDLPLETLGGPMLHVVAINSKRVQNIVAYIKHTVRCMHHDFTQGMLLPTRLIKIAEMDLDGEASLATHLYKLAMSGIFTSTIKEWLGEVVKEAGHKRWDQAMNTMYTNLQSHIFHNLKPALDRLAIAALRIRGYARAADGFRRTFVDPDLFSKLLDDVDSLKLVVERMLLRLNEEYQRFRAFSKWLRVVVDIAIAGPGTKSSNEIEERELQNVHFDPALAYMQHSLGWSCLQPHFCDHSEGSLSREMFFAHPIIKQLNRKDVIAGLQNEQTLSEQASNILFSIPTLTAKLAAQSRVALDEITKWQSTMLKPATEIDLKELPLNSTSVLDMKVSPSNIPNGCVTDILIKPVGLGTENHLSVVQVTKANNSHQTRRLDCEILTGAIHDAKWLPWPGLRCLVLQWDPVDSKASLLRCDLVAYGLDTASWVEVLHVWKTGRISQLVSHFIVGGRPGKMVCVVFSKQNELGGHMSWEVLDLEQSGVSAGAVDSDVDMG